MSGRGVWGSLALLTDLYQITMAYGYWKTGRHRLEAVFHHTFRTLPFGGGFALACGLTPAIEYLEAFRFEEDDLAYLAGLVGDDGAPLLEPAFLDYLRDLRLACDVDMVPEGTVVFPHEPLIRVTGPILHCQLLETPLLTFFNFQTLVATKAARICEAAEGDPVIEFGLRRAQGIDGGLSASRAAYIGGCAATSNVLAGRTFGIPVKGTHAHSWVMSFDDELASFEGYAAAMPNNCVFLVDTYDTLAGVEHAIRVGRKLREQGHEMVGIRLDSGDLAYLSIEARRMLDEAGFPGALILASNDLDDRLVASLKQQGAKISAWGVGTRLATAYEEPALGGVYKLAAIKDAGGAWQPRIKLSEQAVKTTTPGVQQVRRFFSDKSDRSVEHDGRLAVADMIYNELDGIADPPTIVDPADPTRRRRFDAAQRSEDLLVPGVRGGEVVYDFPPLPDIQARTRQQLEQFHPAIRRLDNPHEHPVGLEEQLYELKNRMISEARTNAERGVRNAE